MSQWKCVLWQRVYVGNTDKLLSHLCCRITLLVRISLLCALICGYSLVIIFRDIIRGSPDVKWETIKGLENAKRLLKEAVVMPIKYPQ